MQINICYDGESTKSIADMKFFVEYYFNSIFDKAASSVSQNDKTISQEDIAELFKLKQSVATDSTTTLPTGDSSYSPSDSSDTITAISDEDIKKLF